MRESTNLTHALLSLICEQHVHWENAIAAEDLTHIIDFGPGGASGIGGLTYRNKEGTGVQILLAGALEGSNRDLSYKADLFDSDIRAVTYSQNWSKVFQPKLIKTTR
jgi:fatty acid synthase subunit beta